MPRSCCRRLQLREQPMWRSWDLEVWTDTVSVELEDFDFGLESAGDQGDDSFGELQRI